MQKKFSFKNNRLAKTIVCSGLILIVSAFIIIRYEGFFSAVSKVLNIFRPVIIGGVIAFALNRPMNFFHVKYRQIFAAVKNSFRKKKYGKKVHMVSGKAPFIMACITTYLVMFAIIIGIVCFIVPQISESVVLFGENFSGYANNLMNFIESNRFNITAFIDDKIDLNKLVEKADDIISNITDYIPNFLSKTVDITSSIINGTIDVVVGLVFSVYILLDKQRLKKSAKILTKIILKNKYEKFEKIITLGYDTFSNFISGQLMEAVILGVLCFVGMTIFGFDYAPLISVIIGITNMIPIVGPIFGTIPGAFIQLLVNPIKAVWFVVFIIVIQQIDSNLIYPKVVGNSIGLPALWVLFAITVGGGIGGVLGMVLGVPIVSIIYTLVKEKIRDAENGEYELNSKDT
ncbi:AI-2E family transporter [Porcipelethomonas sp.]|uniref:AI-2E family transporter n=1 Tax=Porcipelethomonas sp. TaxID=2981675 RepID=UPI003EF4745B